MHKIIHISSDEKFINSAYYQFEKVSPNQNEFYIYGTIRENIKHIKLNDTFHFFELSQNFFELFNDSIIIFHSLPNELIKYLQFINKSNKVVWLLFGFETYEDKLLYPDNVLLDTITYKHFKTKSNRFSFKEQLKYYLFPIIRKLKRDLYYSKQEYQIIRRNEKLNNLKRVDYFGFAFDEEYKFQCELLNIKRPFFYFGYYPLEFIVNIKIEIKQNKNKIIIGHSGFPNGNHLDVINKIKNYNLSDVEVVIPFSYGEKNYINFVKNEISSKNIEVTFLEDFIPLSDYSELLNDVKIAILNNRRQQAIGNIITLIYFGAKVFLSEKNTFYQFLKRQNIIIYNYENELNDNSINFELTKEEMIFNKQKMIELFSEKKLLSGLQSSIENGKNGK
ncbi:TDP-N-acetylfucosamine:lipid II N-acetylfucosaminyltransferase [Empedobacter tilapiae]|uniref:4-alpha-L-fucosyltransferase n=1 Tax=Empedobacter tilapiae TaxID=2491114 RepID=A0A4Z1B1M3_9FLAO|nr:TDP-N-acetylfucosamine:lipid II N-acetylfucosaminyltransferase [Empedobacter tilapiae]TGN27173.1 hypothetical protein E4J94_08120 [Empedobacter tilapiae]